MIRRDQLAAAVKRLEEALGEGSSAFLRRTDGGRQAAVMQLSAVRRFIATVLEPGVRSQTAPLDALQFALEDLNRGARPTIVEPAHVSGRRPNATDREVIKSYAWTAVDRLERIGFKPDKACQLVARVLIQCGVSFEGSSIATRNVVKQWCKEIRRDLSLTTIEDDSVSQGLNAFRCWAEHDAHVINDQVLPMIKRGERTLEETKDYFLFQLSVDLSWAGEANRPGDGMKARWQKENDRLHREQLVERALRSQTGEKG